MRSLDSHDSREQDFEELRRLMARIAEKRGRTPIQTLRTYAGLGSERVAELLASRFVLVLAGGLSVVLAVFLIQGPDKNGQLSTGITTANGIEPGTPGDVEKFAEVQRHVGSSSEIFIIRVGSFRDPANANRVVELLREKTLDVKIEVVAGGLHVVTLGPFSGKAAAEEIARSVRQIVGLAPQVIPLD